MDTHATGTPGRATPALTGRNATNPNHLLKAKIVLLRLRGSGYLRYMHFRNYLAKVADEISTVCVCGAGGGFAEVAAAMEFPHIHFTLTDIITRDKKYPAFERAMDFAWRVGINNMSFSVWDVLMPTRRRFDLVASTEMLEHIEDDTKAVHNMRAAATKYVYCLVPHAEASANADAALRKRAWERCQHYVAGYDSARIKSLFGEPVLLGGAYWAPHHEVFRAGLNAMSLEEIDLRAHDLFAQASLDDVEGVPATIKDAFGIKILSRA